MKSKKYLKIVEHYENCLRQYGDSHLGVDWPKEDDAALRYRIMLELIPANRVSTLLDFGCGIAHLYGYLIKNGFKNISYTGLDISSEFIETCKQKYPGVPFKCLDLLESGEQVEMYDYIILNGVFTEKCGLSFDEMYDYFKRLIKAVFLKADHAMAFNVMTKHVDWEREDLFHLPFDLLGAFLKSEVTRNYIIRNDYGLFEYTVYLFKESYKWQK